jgi:hypothetical protein
MKIETWQMLSCIATPQVRATVWDSLNIRYNSTFKIHFYAIALLTSSGTSQMILLTVIAAKAIFAIDIFKIIIGNRSGFEISPKGRMDALLIWLAKKIPLKQEPKIAPAILASVLALIAMAILISQPFTSSFVIIMCILYIFAIIPAAVLLFLSFRSNQRMREFFGIKLMPTPKVPKAPKPAEGTKTPKAPKPPRQPTVQYHQPRDGRAKAPMSGRKIWNLIKFIIFTAIIIAVILIIRHLFSWVYV